MSQAKPKAKAQKIGFAFPVLGTGKNHAQIVDFHLSGVAYPCYVLYKSESHFSAARLHLESIVEKKDVAKWNQFEAFCKSCMKPQTMHNKDGTINSFEMSKPAFSLSEVITWAHNDKNAGKKPEYDGHIGSSKKATKAIEDSKDPCLMDILKFADFGFNYGSQDSQDGQIEGKQLGAYWTFRAYMRKTYSNYKIKQTVSKYKLSGNAVDCLLVITK